MSKLYPLILNIIIKWQIAFVEKTISMGVHLYLFLEIKTRQKNFSKNLGRDRKFEISAIELVILKLQ
jgi:hypothetical protein